MNYDARFLARIRQQNRLKLIPNSGLFNVMVALNLCPSLFAYEFDMEFFIVMNLVFGENWVVVNPFNQLINTSI